LIVFYYLIIFLLFCVAFYGVFVLKDLKRLELRGFVLQMLNYGNVEHMIIFN